MYPENDVNFEDMQIINVESHDNGWIIYRDGGWSFFISSSSSITPYIGMKARFYGNGIGYTIRGLFLDGIKIFYRSEAEDKEKQEIERYGVDVQDWLKRWDNNNIVWSIEMGGLGPSYEQCIQIIVAELLRYMIANKFNTTLWQNNDIWKRDLKNIEDTVFSNPIVKNLNPNGAQFNAAISLALKFYIQSPRRIMKDEQLKDRHIQISKFFPNM